VEKSFSNGRGLDPEGDGPAGGEPVEMAVGLENRKRVWGRERMGARDEKRGIDSPCREKKTR